MADLNTQDKGHVAITYKVKTQSTHATFIKEKRQVSASYIIDQGQGQMQRHSRLFDELGKPSFSSRTGAVKSMGFPMTEVKEEDEEDEGEEDDEEEEESLFDRTNVESKRMKGQRRASEGKGDQRDIFPMKDFSKVRSSSISGQRLEEEINVGTDARSILNEGQSNPGLKTHSHHHRKNNFKITPEIIFMIVKILVINITLPLLDLVTDLTTIHSYHAVSSSVMTSIAQTLSAFFVFHCLVSSIYGLSFIHVHR